MEGLPTKTLLLVVGLLASPNPALADQKVLESPVSRLIRADLDQDSLAAQFDCGMIPAWALTQDASIVDSFGKAFPLTGFIATDCPPSLDIQLNVPRIAVWFDSLRDITQMFARDANGFILGHDISSDMSYSTFVVPVDSASPRAVGDLDLDGEPEIIAQWGGTLKIISGPDWRIRASITWSGADIVMYPEIIDIDDDPYLEFYVTPNSFGSSRAAIVDYDPVTDTFVVIADIVAPLGAIGESAVGDFDEDGRMEFISGYYDFGYSLFEWQDSALVFVGLVGDTPAGNNYAASACRPKPGGILHALIGHSSAGQGYRYQLLEPTGDNTFKIVHTFQEFTGWLGAHPNHAADTDCDGLDEICMSFYPLVKVWEWMPSPEQYVTGCIWDATETGTFTEWRSIDADNNGRPEWSAMSDPQELYWIIPDPDCDLCDSNTACNLSNITCLCYCHADPSCDGITNVLDAVWAVNVAFRGEDPEPSLSTCPYVRTDVTCDGVTNVLDVVHFVEVAFRGANPGIEFCKPCPVQKSTGARDHHSVAGNDCPLAKHSPLFP